MALGKLLNKLMPAGENLDGLFYCGDEIILAAKSFCRKSVSKGNFWVLNLYERRTKKNTIGQD